MAATAAITKAVATSVIVHHQKSNTTPATPTLAIVNSTNNCNSNVFNGNIMMIKKESPDTTKTTTTDTAKFYNGSLLN